MQRNTTRVACRVLIVIGLITTAAEQGVDQLVGRRDGVEHLANARGLVRLRVRKAQLFVGPQQFFRFVLHPRGIAHSWGGWN